MAPKPPKKVLFTQAQIAQRLDAMAAQILKDYKGKRLLCLVVLRGGFFFAADLIRRIASLDPELDFVRLTSYVGARSGRAPVFRGQLPSCSGYDVLVIEDLVDTGTTLSTLDQAIRAQGPNSLRYAVAVDKKARRQVEFTADYIAFDLERDVFLVGYGMDHEGKFRTLPDIREAAQ
ncbi:MAG: hypoxanthine phosphoribosyltransferase [Planctomycetaceae bacterium]|nr:Hypoxanthine-guanine phosphoribosyltransferase [Planctomycetota bacterium]MCQ3949501.1 hypoxanthine phosphoribosyltransferase [Planctomycetota bacterium]NUO15161.1 hypoxanthine phosphoribosyltransferase [Planctomycetaceae bacterium]HRJ78002.1 phosphoribosyltransferase family protein [Planctomycetota bacterium]